MGRFMSGVLVACALSIIDCTCELDLAIISVGLQSCQSNLPAKWHCLNVRTKSYSSEP